MCEFGSLSYCVNDKFKPNTQFFQDGRFGEVSRKTNSIYFTVMGFPEESQFKKALIHTSKFVIFFCVKVYK